MFLYLSTEQSSVVKLNGNTIFAINKCAKKIEIDENNLPLIEIFCLNDRSNSFCFYPTEEFLSSPPKSVISTKILCDYHLLIKRDYSNLSFKVICQKKLGDAVITVFCDRGYKISIETMFDYFLQDLDFEVLGAEIFDIDQNQNVFINLLGNENTLCAFNLKDKISLVFLKKVFSFELSPTLSTIEKFPTHLKHEKRCEWEFCEQEFKIKKVSVFVDDDKKNELTEKVTPYVFLEGLYLGEDVKEYLCDNLIPHKQKFFDYLGEFIGVFPPPPSVKHDLVGLLYKRKENVYYTAFVKVEILNDKVINVELID